MPKHSKHRQLRSIGRVHRTPRAAQRFSVGFGDSIENAAGGRVERVKGPAGGGVDPLPVEQKPPRGAEELSNLRLELEAGRAELVGRDSAQRPNQCLHGSGIGAIRGLLPYETLTAFSQRPASSFGTTWRTSKLHKNR